MNRANAAVAVADVFSIHSNNAIKTYTIIYELALLRLESTATSKTTRNIYLFFTVKNLTQAGWQ